MQRACAIVCHAAAFEIGNSQHHQRQYCTHTQPCIMSPKKHCHSRQITITNDFPSLPSLPCRPLQSRHSCWSCLGTCMCSQWRTHTSRCRSRCRSKPCKWAAWRGQSSCTVGY